MSDDRPDRDSNGFEATLRAIAAEVTRSAERLSKADLGDLDHLARATGIDPERARGMAEGAGRWLRDQADQFDFDVTVGSSAPTGDPQAAPAAEPTAAAGPTGAGPDPLDLPTVDQGRALAALDSGRWTIEPGTTTLATQTGKGTMPENAHTLGYELHVRDWVDADGELTLAGGHALGRWLAVSTPAE